MLCCSPDVKPANDIHMPYARTKEISGQHGQKISVTCFSGLRSFNELLAEIFGHLEEIFPKPLGSFISQVVWCHEHEQGGRKL